MMRFARNLISGFAALMIVSPALSQDMDDVEIEVESLDDQVHMLTGRGGNIGLVVTDGGAFLIDDQYAPLTERILEAVESVTDQPIRFVLNTHWHGDHTGGNENLAEAGSMIVAHENVRERLSTEQVSDFFDRTTPPAPDGALPAITFSDSVTFHPNGETVHVFHVPNAHTDGDAVVHLPESDVIHAGDVVFYGLYPFVDVDSGGSLAGMIDGVERIAELAGDDTQIIPGHGPLIDREQLLEYHHMLKTVHDRLSERVRFAQSLEEIKAAGITDEFDEKWGGGFIPPERWVELLYRDAVDD